MYKNEEVQTKEYRCGLGIYLEVKHVDHPGCKEAQQQD